MAEDGVVTLRGEVLASELGDVIAGVRTVRGVRDVRNELSVFENEAELTR
jgi:osmotically-inducible protein OsmY